MRKWDDLAGKLEEFGRKFQELFDTKRKVLQGNRLKV